LRKTSVLVRQVGKARKAANQCEEKHAAFASSNRLTEIVLARTLQFQGLVGPKSCTLAIQPIPGSKNQPILGRCLSLRSKLPARAPILRITSSM